MIYEVSNGEVVKTFMDKDAAERAAKQLANVFNKTFAIKVYKDVWQMAGVAYNAKRD